MEKLTLKSEVQKFQLKLDLRFCLSHSFNCTKQIAAILWRLHRPDRRLWLEQDTEPQIATNVCMEKMSF